MKKLIGPFAQVLTMDKLPTKGALKDEQLEIISNGALLSVDGKIDEVASFERLRQEHPDAIQEEVESKQVVLPGLIDCHTHLCYAGSRARDYAARNNGKTYQEIAAAGGGIWDTVTKTREASQAHLETEMLNRMNTLLRRGVTTVEVKSGYGLSLEEELKLLRAIQQGGDRHPIDCIATCLAAHIIPREFTEEADYLDYIIIDLVPAITSEKLASRFDIFIEENAFTPSKSTRYLQLLRQKGFQLTVHGDQFTSGGSSVAIEVGAASVDHLEASGPAEIVALSKSETVPVILPGASLGLGMPYAPARKLLNAGCTLAIASDWNPGSAPNGNLLMQAALLGASEKLSSVEIFAGLTSRAAHALRLEDRGALKPGLLADLIAFPANDYREILYHQGEMQPSMVWKRGLRVDHF